MHILKDVASFLKRAALAGVCLLMSSCAHHSIGRVPVAPDASVSTTPSRIAITIDDLPYVIPSKTRPNLGLRYVKSINAALQKHDITATGFAVGQQINPKSIKALQAFANAGHTIGNHSWSHPDYGTLTPQEFLDETRKTDEILAPWITGPRYYRFPFLREGKTKQTQSAATRILTDLDYQNVPVSIDNDDWKFNADYLAAIKRNDRDAAAVIARDYIAHMQNRTAHFQSFARTELGGDVDHILLLHMNRINADHLETLLDWYAAQDWTFITVGEALSDPFYARPNRYTGNLGLSQIERVVGRKSD
ncbi:MAG: polysaccharide deacetylase family protein [Aliishimia sp.]